MKNLIAILLITFTVASFAQEYKVIEHKENINGILLLDSQERIWTRQGEKVLLYDGASWQEQAVTVDRDAWGGIRTRFFEDSKGNIWGTNKTEIFKFSDNKWEKFPYQSKPFHLLNTIFEDNQGRIYFISKDYNVAIHDNGKFVFITENLPEKITRIINYGNGVLFGDKFSWNKEYFKPCGLYDGEYKLLTEGKLFVFFNLVEGRMVSKGYYLNDISEFDKYPEMLGTGITKEGIVFLTEKLAGYYNFESKTITEFSIDQKYWELLPEASNLLYYNQQVYIATSKGLLKLYNDKNELLNEDNKLADDHVLFIDVDEYYNLLVYHEKAVSVQINEEWKHFDKKSGFEFEIVYPSRMNFIPYNNKYFISLFTGPKGYGKAKLLEFDGEKWSTYPFKSVYYVKPFVMDGNIWFAYHNGNTHKGLQYFDGSQFNEFSPGKGLASNYIYDIMHTDKYIYLVTQGLKGPVNFYKIGKE